MSTNLQNVDVTHVAHVAHVAHVKVYSMVKNSELHFTLCYRDKVLVHIWLKVFI